MTSFSLSGFALCLFSTTLLFGCGYGENKSACAGGCRDVCSPRYSSQCVDDYRQGYFLGHADGLNDRLTDGVNSDAYVAGYWDGIADGQAARPQR